LGYILGDLFHKLIWPPWLVFSNPDLAHVEKADDFQGLQKRKRGPLAWTLFAALNISEVDATYCM
jgi:hypothetical protein